MSILPKKLLTQFSKTGGTASHPLLSQYAYYPELLLLAYALQLIHEGKKRKLVFLVSDM